MVVPPEFTAAMKRRGFALGRVSAV